MSVPGGPLPNAAGAQDYRDIQLLGTDAAVPELEKLLADEALSHAARQSLQAIGTPRAIAAMREALGRVTGTQRLGLIATLGSCRDVQAVPALTRLAVESEVPTARAAIAALGEIPAEASAQGLANLAAGSATLRENIGHARLRWAFLAEQRGATGAAEREYARLYSQDEPTAIQAAALAGMLRVSPAQRGARLAEALRGTDPVIANAALAAARGLGDPATRRTVREMMPHLPPERQIAAIGIIGEWVDRDALGAVKQAAKSSNPRVQEAAFWTLGRIGDESTFELMLQAAADAPDEAVRRAATDALAALPDRNLGGFLVSRLPTATPKMQTEIARALRARAESDAIPALMEVAKTAPLGTKNVALQAVVGLVTPAHLGFVLDVQTATQDEATRKAMASALAVLARKAANTREGQLDSELFLQKTNAAAGPSRVALISASGWFRDPAVRALLRRALNSADQEERAAARGALLQTTDPALLEDIVHFARAEAPGLQRSRAVESCVRLVSTAGATLQGRSPAATLAELYSIAATREDKWQVLRGAATVPAPETLALAKNALTDSDVRAEAEVAVLAIAVQLTKAAGAAQSALSELASSAADAKVRAEAQATLQPSKT